MLVAAGVGELRADYPAMKPGRAKPIVGILVGGAIALICPTVAVWSYYLQAHQKVVASGSASDYSERLSSHLAGMLVTAAGGAIGLLIGLAILIASIIVFVRASAAPSPAAARITTLMVGGIGAAFGAAILLVALFAYASIAPFKTHSLRSTLIKQIDTPPPSATLTLRSDGALFADDLPVQRGSLAAFLKSRAAHGIIVRVARGVSYDQRVALLHELEDNHIDKIYFQDETK